MNVHVLLTMTVNSPLLVLLEIAAMANVPLNLVVVTSFTMTVLSLLSDPQFAAKLITNA